MQNSHSDFQLEVPLESYFLLGKLLKPHKFAILKFKITLASVNRGEPAGWLLFVHPAFFSHFSRFGLQHGLKQKSPDFPLSQQLLPASPGNTEGFPSQPTDIISPTCPGSALPVGHD